MRARLAGAIADAEAARHDAEERRARLEADLRERTAQLARVRAQLEAANAAAARKAPDAGPEVKKSAEPLSVPARATAP